MRQYRALYIGGTLVMLATFLLFVPVTDERTIRDGTDEFGAHHALWGQRVKSVTETATSPIRDIGLILVNMKHASSLAPVVVRVTTEGGGVVGNKTIDIPASIDDEFTWFQFDSVIIQPGDRYTIEVSAPTATQALPVGVRFDMDSKELALSVHERIPVWGKLMRWIDGHQKRFFLASRMALGGIVLAALFLFLEYVAGKNKKMGVLCALIFLACVTLYIRIPLSESLESAYGGDAFNYILKGNAWVVGADPFAADPRKAPLYSFLTAPGLLPGLDPILWARGISIVAAMGTVVLVALFLLRVGAPLSLALGGGLLLSVNRDYQFESIQGLSNSLYAFLILASAYAFISQRKYLVSVFGALAALTRYEGAAAAGILIPSMWVTYPGKIRTILREVLPFIILASIPFIMTPLTGDIGVRTVSDLTGDEGLYIAHSWEYFLPSIQAFKNFFGRLWILVSGVGHPFAAFGYGALLGIVGTWFFQRYGHPRKMLVIFPAILCTAFLGGVLWGDGSEMKFFIVLFSGLTGLGVTAALYYNVRVYLPVVCMVAVQTAVITAILPKNRYYLHILPFIAIAIAGGIWLLAGAKKASRVSWSVSVLALSIMISFVYLQAGEALSGQFSDYNEKSADQTVLVQAGRYLKKNEGIVAIYEGADLPMRVYLPLDRLVYFTDRIRETQLQYEKIKSSGATLLLNTTDHPYFTELLKEMPEKFQEVATFKTRWSHITSTVYRVY